MAPSLPRGRRHAVAEYTEIGDHMSTVVVRREPEPGDLIGLKDVPIGVAQGRVFDIIGDVARIWWVDSGLNDAAVEGLMPVKVSELRLLQRPAAFIAVRFIGTPTEEPYAFVVADLRVENVRGALHVFETADRYEVVHHNLDTDTDTDTDTDETEDETNDGSDER